MSENPRMHFGYRAKTAGAPVPAGASAPAGAPAPAGASAREPVGLDPADLLTHAVCLGATGSGKTGLLIALLEEASLAGIPILALDPKGDLTNLALVFPELAPADFAPWIEPDAARRAGVTIDAMAQETAERWQKGLAADGIDADRRRRLAASREIRLYAPGSDAATPIDVIANLAAPAPAIAASEEALGDAVSSAAGALLGLLGIAAEPLTSKEHVLLSAVLESAWRSGRSLDLAQLIAEVLTPPFARVGVFEVDRFMPPKERETLALALNALVAAPGFALWRRGVRLDVPALLGTAAGGATSSSTSPRAPLALVYLAHLSERERMFAAASVLGAVVRWMREQSGTGDLRLLVVMDEVYGFLPPHPAAPPAKAPILTLLKQGRAFGIGVVLATQNPVDVDYKALSNASTWLLGRLATGQDRERVLDALRGAGGDDASLGPLLAALAPREFVLHRAARPPVPFRSRFAMSYLRGPLTRVDLGRLVERGLVVAPPAPGSPSAILHGGAQKTATPRAEPVAGSPARPALPAGTPERFLAPGAAALAAAAAAIPALTPALAPAPAGAEPLLAPLVAARVALRFDDTALKLEHQITGTLLGLPARDGTVTWADAPADLDLAALPSAAPPAGARYLALPSALAAATGFRRAATALSGRLLSSQKMTLYSNKALKLASVPGESPATFAARVARAADDRAAGALAALRERYAARIERIEKQLARADERHAGEKDELSARKREEVLAAGESVLGFLFGRRSLRTLSGAASRRRMTESAESQAERAASEVERLRQELAALNDELEDKAAELAAAADAQAAGIDEIAVGLERDDVRIEEIGILWCAVAAPPDGFAD